MSQHMDLQLSYVHGGGTLPLLGETLGACFDRIVERFGEREALVVRHQNIRWTYRDLQRRVNNLAVALLRLGMNPGERIGIWSQNNAEWLLVQLATAKAGLILVNINPAYRSSELQYALNKVQCRALIVSPSFKSSNYLEMLQELAPELAHSKPGKLAAAALPSLALVIRLGEERTPGMLNFDALLGDASEAELARLESVGATLQFDDPINIQFTSGTTGQPKGATLTHHNILNNGYFVGAAMQLQRRSIACAFPCRCITVSAWCSAIWSASHTARRWSTRMRPSTPSPCSRPSQPSVAPRCMACRRCSSPCSSTRALRTST